MRNIGFLIFPGFDPLDLTGPLEVFEWAERQRPGSYSFRILSMSGGMVQSWTRLAVASEACGEPSLDTLIVIGGAGHATRDGSSELIEFIRATCCSARRVASICTGAFLLAAAGLLDRRSATTHWLFVDQLRARYPLVDVRADRIFVADRPIWTSAGIAAGIDMSLALVEDDLGSDVSRAIARLLVLYHRRAGGQRQISALLDVADAADRIRDVMSYARENLQQPLSIERLAAVAHLSPRQFSRAFRAATGVSPAKAVEQLRIDAARPRIEEGRETLEEVARATGFGDAGRMRRAFIRAHGAAPRSARQTARSNMTEKRANRSA